MKLRVEGKGIMADMYRAIISNMDPRSGKAMTLDTTPCLPKGSEPDYAKYKTIGQYYNLCCSYKINVCLLFVFIDHSLGGFYRREANLYSVGSVQM